MPTSDRFTKNPAHPDFPHGTNRGYTRGCRARGCVAVYRAAADAIAADCVAAHSKAVEMADLRRLRGVRGANDLVPSGPTLAHAASLRASSGGNRVSAAAIAAAAQAKGHPVTKHQVENALSGTWQRVRRGTERAVLDVTAADVGDHAVQVAAAPLRILSGQLRAMGYNATWQARAVGESGSQPRVMVHAQVGRERADRMRALHARYCDRPATPAETGIPQWRIDRTRREALAAGMYPAACYDDDGTLIPGAVRDGRTGRLASERPDVEAYDRRRIEALRLVVDGKTPREAAALTGIAERNVTGARSRLGLTLEDNPEWDRRDPEWKRSLVGKYRLSALGLRVVPHVREAHRATQIGDATEAWEALLRAADGEAAAMAEERAGGDATGEAA